MTNSQSIITPSTLIDSCRSWIVWLLLKDSTSWPSSPPPKIDGFTLVHPVFKTRGRQKYASGVYTKAGHRYFIKIWTGKIPNFDYYDLVNEYFLGRVLHHHLGSVSFTTPQPVAYFRSPGQLSVVFQYIPGRPLSKFPPRFQKQVLTQVITSLASLSGKPPALPRREPIYFLVSATSLFLASLFSRSAPWVQIWSRYWICLAHLPALFKSSLVVSHRDLFLDNLLISNGSVYLLDCASLALTPPGCDLAYLAKRDGLHLPLPRHNRAFFDSYAFLMSQALKDL